MTGNIEGEHNAELFGVISNKWGMQSKRGGIVSRIEGGQYEKQCGENHLRVTCCCWNLYRRALRFIEFVIRKTGGAGKNSV